VIKYISPTITRLLLLLLLLVVVVSGGCGMTSLPDAAARSRCVLLM